MHHVRGASVPVWRVALDPIGIVIVKFEPAGLVVVNSCMFTCPNSWPPVPPMALALAAPHEKLSADVGDGNSQPLLALAPAAPREKLSAYVGDGSSQPLLALALAAPHEKLSIQDHPPTFGGNGCGLAESALYDEEGLIGQATQSLAVRLR